MSHPGSGIASSSALVFGATALAVTTLLSRRAPSTAALSIRRASAAVARPARTTMSQSAAAGAGTGAGAGAGGTSTPSSGASLGASVKGKGSARPQRIHVCVYAPTAESAAQVAPTVAWLRRVVDPGSHVVQTLSSEGIVDDAWQAHTALLVLPDADAGAYASDSALNSARGRTSVAGFINGGGSVLGICEGARACFGGASDGSSDSTGLGLLAGSVTSVDSASCGNTVAVTGPGEPFTLFVREAGCVFDASSLSIAAGSGVVAKDAKARTLASTADGAVGVSVQCATSGGEGRRDVVTLLGANVEAVADLLAYSHAPAVAALEASTPQRNAALCSSLQAAGVTCAEASSGERVTASSIAFMCGTSSFVSDWMAKFAARAKPFNEWAVANAASSVPEAADGVIHTGTVNVAMFPTAAAAAAAEASIAAAVAAGTEDKATPDVVRIVPCPDTKPTDVAFDWDAYQRALNTREMGRTVLYADVIGSTQTTVDGNYHFLKSIPGGSGLVVVAARQTRGRGRRSNQWISPAGSISATILLHVTLPSVFLQYACPLAVVQGIKGLGSGYEELDLCVKWPNDIYYRDPAGKLHKLGGVLVTSMQQQSGFYMFVGCGINVNNERPAVSVNSIIAEYNRHNPDATPLAPLAPEQVLGLFLTQFERLSQLVLRSGWSSIESMYYKHWVHGGQRVTIDDGSGRGATVQATVARVDSSDGTLVVVEDAPGAAAASAGGASGARGREVRLWPSDNSFDMTHNLIRPKPR